MRHRAEPLRHGEAPPCRGRFHSKAICLPLSQGSQPECARDKQLRGVDSLQGACAGLAIWAEAVAVILEDPFDKRTAPDCRSCTEVTHPAEGNLVERKLSSLGADFGDLLRGKAAPGLGSVGTRRAGLARLVKIGTVKGQCSPR